MKVMVWVGLALDVEFNVELMVVLEGTLGVFSLEVVGCIGVDVCVEVARLLALLVVL